MAEAQAVPTPAVRMRSPKRKLWQDILSATVGFCIGAAFLVFVGAIVSMDVLMPGHAFNRNINRTKVTFLETMISGLFSKIVAVFAGADTQGGGAAAGNLRQVRNGTQGASLLLIHNMSAPLHADLLEQFHLPVVDYRSDAINNDTATMASDTTDRARASASEAADSTIQGTELTSKAQAVVNASDVGMASSPTFNQSPLKKAHESSFLGLRNDSSRADH
ncbi:uncharacterized protein [Dermacentor albipictus]|uniref:uncharacterized protein n=1 Tax=Dermacentor albipictus TaxID=60249 RepID=UPI0031FE426D